MGKTALAAEAVRAVVGTTDAPLDDNLYPDGVVFLDLYTYQGQSNPAWNRLANSLAGARFMEQSTARERATEACRGLRALIIIEGGEEATGTDGRASIHELLEVLSPENRRLLLTRLNTQSMPAESIRLDKALQEERAAELLDSLTLGNVSSANRDRLLDLLQGHPLALTWAGNLVARGDDDPDRLIDEWESSPITGLGDPTRAEHTLAWLYDRSVRNLDALTRKTLAAAGLLARAPFPLPAIVAACGDSGVESGDVIRDSLRTLVQHGLMRRAQEKESWEFTHVLGYQFARSKSASDQELRERLARWLHKHVEAELAAGSGVLASAGLSDVLEHAAALLRTDDEQQLWMPLAHSHLYHFHDRLVELGQLTLASLPLDAFGGWMERFPDAKAREDSWRRELASLLCLRGDVLSAQGDLSGAQTAHQAGLEIPVCQHSVRQSLL